jgi:molybdopterin-guanine dinucleotide biosynthesis protein A
MGRDKALLPHQKGGVWLTAMIEQLIPLGLPVVVVSRYQVHADVLAHQSGVDVLVEPPPWNGPLQALNCVLSSGSGDAWLVLPVDMPRLTTVVFRQLIDAWRRHPNKVGVAHDGERLQPLLAIIPSGAPFETCLSEQLSRGCYRWLDWLERVPYESVLLPSGCLLNVNQPRDLSALSE